MVREFQKQDFQTYEGKQLQNKFTKTILLP